MLRSLITPEKRQLPKIVDYLKKENADLLMNINLDTFEFRIKSLIVAMSEFEKVMKRMEGEKQPTIQRAVRSYAACLQYSGFLAKHGHPTKEGGFDELLTSNQPLEPPVVPAPPPAIIHLIEAERGQAAAPPDEEEDERRNSTRPRPGDGASGLGGGGAISATAPQPPPTGATAAEDEDEDDLYDFSALFAHFGDTNLVEDADLEDEPFDDPATREASEQDPLAVAPTAVEAASPTPSATEEDNSESDEDSDSDE